MTAPGLGRGLDQILAPTGPTARMFDPETSRLAGQQAARPDRLTGKQRYVLSVLAAAQRSAARDPDLDEGLTDFEYGALQQTSAGKRRKELERAGLVEWTGRTRPSPSGSPARVYRITPAGHTVWHADTVQGRARTEALLRAS